MSASGTYEEKLPCGGTLSVTKSSWMISYYFPGPDRRYNGTGLSIAGKSIELYIDGFQENWAELERLKVSMPSGGQFAKQEKMGMWIRIGGHWPGVSLQSYYMTINSLGRLTQ